MTNEQFEALVEKAAEAIRKDSPLIYGSHTLARAALRAVLPDIQAIERERAATVCDDLAKSLRAYRDHMSQAFHVENAGTAIRALGPDLPDLRQEAGRMNYDITQLRTLHERVREADGPDREIDREIGLLLDGWRVKGRMIVEHGNEYVDDPGGMYSSFTEDVHVPRALIRRVLPAWWYTSGLCELTGHASIGPDYNGCERERLFREFPEERFGTGFDEDLAPGDGPHRECYALLACLLAALIAQAERGNGAP